MNCIIRWVWFGFKRFQEPRMNEIGFDGLLCLYTRFTFINRIAHINTHTRSSYHWNDLDLSPNRLIRSWTRDIISYHCHFIIILIIKLKWQLTCTDICIRIFADNSLTCGPDNNGGFVLQTPLLHMRNCDMCIHIYLFRSFYSFVLCALAW